MARPGRRISTNSPAGSGFPFQDNTATIYTIANTGAMLILGQERSRDRHASRDWSGFRADATLRYPSCRPHAGNVEEDPCTTDGGGKLRIL